jgi:hypothetical protein
MKIAELKIVEDFSRTPGVRYKCEGMFSGEEFRTDVLLPRCEKAISEKSKLKIFLDGTAGLGTSFLEEAFGGLIRENNLDYNCLKDILIFVSDENPDYIEEINEYMKNAYEKKCEIK